MATDIDILSSQNVPVCSQSNGFRVEPAPGFPINYVYGIGKKSTVEVGNVHTLSLESLKLVFQPLHPFLVNKL